MEEEAYFGEFANACLEGDLDLAKKLASKLDSKIFYQNEYNVYFDKLLVDVLKNKKYNVSKWLEKLIIQNKKIQKTHEILAENGNMIVDDNLEIRRQQIYPKNDKATFCILL